MKLSQVFILAGSLFQLGVRGQCPPDFSCNPCNPVRCQSDAICWACDCCSFSDGQGYL
ncbi:hypothetical protein B0T14DRAFT_517325 [Immersiella caudata]|uniref:Uncharacterized protein n=1 Tax=Immersiella caudata TaxID=314043 RepID=A0AA40C3R8_9PEZI|nr:hypothetical protein B0T14DRAFT_517325 [Immersiella caudata]